MKSAGLDVQIFDLVLNCLLIPLRASCERSLSDKRLLYQVWPPDGTVDLPGPTERLKQSLRGLPALLLLHKSLQSLQHQAWELLTLFLFNRRNGGG